VREHRRFRCLYINAVSNGFIGFFFRIGRLRVLSVRFPAERIQHYGADRDNDNRTYHLNYGKHHA
jgi:hypothetical protein